MAFVEELPDQHEPQDPRHTTPYRQALAGAAVLLLLLIGWG